MRQLQATNPLHRAPAGLSQEGDSLLAGASGQQQESNRLLVEPTSCRQTVCSWNEHRPRTATCKQEAYLDRVGKLQKLPVAEVQPIAGQGTAKLPEDARCLLTIHDPAADRWHSRGCCNFLCRCCSSAALTLTAYRTAGVRRLGHLLLQLADVQNGLHRQPDSPGPVPPRHHCCQLEELGCGKASAPTRAQRQQLTDVQRLPAELHRQSRLLVQPGCNPKLADACCPTWCSSCRQSSAAATCHLHPAPGWGS